MTRVVAVVLSALPFEPGSRRALDETLQDWVLERDGAAGPARVVMVNVSGLASVIRAVALASLGEIRGLPFASLAWRAALCVLPFTILGGFDAVQFSRRFESAPFIAIVAPLLLSIVAMQLPGACFVASAWTSRTRRVPAVAALLLGGVVTLAVTGWLVPHANQGFRETVFRLTSGSDVRMLPSPGPSELTLPEIVEAAIAEPTGIAAHLLTDRFGFAALGATLACLGVAIGVGRRRWSPLILWLAMPAYILSSVWLSDVVGLAVFSWAAASLSGFLVLALGRATVRESAVPSRHS